MNSLDAIKAALDLQTLRDKSSNLEDVLEELQGKFDATTGHTHSGEEDDGPIVTGIATLQAKFDATTGHTHSGTAGDGPVLPQITSLQAKFDPSTGHTHSGTAGDGPVLKARYAVTLFVPSVSANASASAKQAAFQMPHAATLVEVSVFCTAQAGTEAPQVDVYEGDASVLSSAITLAEAGTCYVATPSDSDIADDAEVSVRCVTDTDGSITNLTVVLTFEKVVA